ncbi:MAG: HIT domain-containing protein [Proteobacteria bacterium]|nr:HIT domain-containing protein [Pseudomonadota bacterium]
MQSFSLHPRLEADTVLVADWGLSRVLLMNDARYPWLVLVPRRVGLTELHDLNHAESLVLTEELRRASSHLKALTGAAKINVGALGNLVPQLHVHVIARNPGDAAWPGPVWGQGATVPYEPSARDAFLAKLKAGL